MFKLNSKILRWVWLAVICTGIWPHMAMAASSPLAAYAWQDRLLVMITHPDQSALRERVHTHFTMHACAHNQRQLRLLSFMTTDDRRARLPFEMQVKTGLWLIGYDGGIKAHSPDAALLSQLHDIIDAMPIRRREMRQQTTDCEGL